MKSYTDIEQSIQLAEILPIESADMYYPNRTDVKYQGALPIEFKYGNPLLSQEIAAWSLAALISVLPILERRGYQKAKPRLLYDVTINKWIVNSHVYTTDAYDNPVDACYEMILKLHELNLL